MSQKTTCDYIFYNNLNNKITIIFDTVSSQEEYRSLKDGFISHIIYLVQLSYLGKLHNTKNDKLSRKQHTVCE